MMRLWRILEGTAFPFLTLSGNAGAVALVLAQHAQLAIAVTACLPVGAGLLQMRLARQRRRRKGLRPLRRELQGERAGGRLCLAVGVAVVLTSRFLPTAVVVGIGFAGTALASLRTFAVVADSAIKEEELEIPGLSAVQECSCIERWVRRLTTMPGRLGKYPAKVASATPPIGEVTRLRALPVVLIASSALVFFVIGSALAAEQAIDGSGEGPPSTTAEVDAADRPPPSETTAEGGDETYADLCPELPNPFDVGHDIGALFYYDGGYKAGCGSEAQRVQGTGVWFSVGTCHGHLRSLGVSSPGGDAVLLYGSGARFAWQAALRGELVSAEAARPEGGDVYSIETGEGSYGFARTAPSGGAGSGELHDCTDVTSTDRPFAELVPLMLLHWRNLVEYRAAWSWPHREEGAAAGLAFLTDPGGSVTARGACASESSCYLDVAGVRWPGEGTAYVSLDEFEPHMPPEVP